MNLDSRLSDLLDLQQEIERARIDATIVDLGVPMQTAIAAATQLGISVAKIFKSIVLMTEKGNLLVAVLPGNKRLNLKRTALLVGCKTLRFAKEDIVLKVTGYPAGGTPPICHREALPVYVDRSILSYDEGYGGGGKPELLLKINPRELVRAAHANVVDIGE